MEHAGSLWPSIYDPKGKTQSAATVVLVFGDPASPAAYEVEAFLPESNSYALATFEAADIPD